MPRIRKERPHSYFSYGPASAKKQKTTGFFSNYCGPGGSGSTQHRTDEACKEHDEDYGEMAPDHPYVKYNDADNALVQQLAEHPCNLKKTTRQRS